MTDDLQYFIQITDKWSKRRFAMKLDSSKEFENLSAYLDFLQALQKTDVIDLVNNGRISEAGTFGLEDLRSFIFNIKDDGSLGKTIEDIIFKQRGRSLKNSDSLKFEHRKTDKEGYADIYIAELVLDRDEVPYTRNWNGFYKRKWQINPAYKEFVESVVRSKYADDTAMADKILNCEAKEDKIELVKAVSEVINKSPYEIYSRFTGRNLRFRNGPETLESIMAGKGGNCSEKASAFEFIMLNFGISGRMVLGGDKADGEFPYKDLRRALDEFDFRFKDDAQRYWNHSANLFEVDDTLVLVDATGGPIPYLFCTGDEAGLYFSRQKSLPLWFLADEEEYYYHDAPQDIAHDLLYSLEAFTPDTDLYHVLGPENEDAPFGLIITDELWICPVVYRTEKEFVKYKEEWEQWVEECDRIIRLEVCLNMDSSPQKLILSRLEKENPLLTADLRTAEDNFVDRCRQSWKDPEWKAGFVFVEFRKMD